MLAELLEDTPGALWTLDMLDRARRDHAPDLVRTVVAIDPAVSSKEGSDETGIIVAGKDERGHGWVLEDLSGRYARRIGRGKPLRLTGGTVLIGLLRRSIRAAT